MSSSSPWHTIGFEDRRRLIYRYVNMYGIGEVSTGVHREWRGHHISIKASQAIAVAHIVAALVIL